MRLRKALTLISGLLIAGMILSACANQLPEEPNSSATPQEQQKTLFAYVGAGLKEPVTELAAIYEQETGVKVELTFNNTGALLGQLDTVKKGDIYMPGGMSYLDKAKKKGHIDEIVGPVAVHAPVIITPRGNPAGISSLMDLARPGVKVILPEKEATAMGQAAFKMFNRLGIAEQVEKNVLAYVETAPKVSTSIMMGQGDAGIAEYNNAVNCKDKVDMIEIDESINIVDEVPCASLIYSGNKEETKKFLEFMKNEGPAVFAKHGFKTK
ncbi:MAG: substrate-binding domain-containing protein [Pelotomaculaceae bacterium]|nr:substrate-binding domain-containing protein [Bacillota bacterium]HHU85441.1 solute-binding protein [Peptococcaceae bacterium]